MLTDAGTRARPARGRGAAAEWRARQLSHWQAWLIVDTVSDPEAVAAAGAIDAVPETVAAERADADL